ncbi:Cytochrome c oxidase assembly factor 7 [Acipenser ruthenus]|uniref:Cytochrome c oxidase assembly factor 7 n=1 Tax=Acipenser ruthenus TaxID=7906 RepID=A0A662YP52_ACIRT|nr:Cytochrome c oxidase assembly factor 7 [Acipenser ruthenus]
MVLYRSRGQHYLGGCQRLADYLEGVKKNYEATAQVLKMNCEQNEHPESCYKLGAYYTTGKGASQATSSTHSTLPQLC